MNNSVELKDIMLESMYNSLPKIFRDEDLNQDLLLRRLLSVCIEGGFIPYVDDVVKLYHKYDSSLWSKNDIRKFAKDFGWEFDERLAIEYQRRLIDHMMELFKIRGTKPCINYVANDMTGYDCTIIENYMDNPKEVGIKLHADENDVLPNFYTRSSIGFFLPFYCVPLLIIYYNFFYNEPLEYHSHDLSINLDFYSESNPWKMTISELAYFNGDYNFDGDINFAGGKGGNGPQHQVFFVGRNRFEVPIGTHEIILTPTFDGYYNYNGELYFNNTLKVQKVVCIHEPKYGILRNIETSIEEPINDIDTIKEYDLFFFNGAKSFDGDIDFSGEKFKQIITI